MSHTFDIRFARSAGFAALLEAPSNRLRWKGGGRLSIDDEGVNIAVRRGTLSLFPHSRRIAAADLTEVYREGEALRLEYNTAGARREVMPFWVRDRDTAAQIVKLMPTRHTVELDDAPTRPRFRVDLRVLSLLGVLALGVVGIALLMRDRAPADVAPAIEVVDKVARAPSVEPVLVPIPVAVPVQTPVPQGSPGSQETTPAPRVAVDAGSAGERIDATTVVTMGDPADSTRGSAAAETDRDQARPLTLADALKNFALVAGEARGLQRLYFSLPPEISGARLQELENRWWQLEVKIYNSPGFEVPELRNRIWAELSACRAWRSFLYSYRVRLGAGSGPPSAWDKEQLEFARRLTARAGLSID